MTRGNRFYSLLNYFLLSTFRLRHRNRVVMLLWNKVNSFLLKRNGVVNSVIHGFDVVHNIGYPYPLIARKYNSFNNPFLELIYLVYGEKNRKINLIDIGSAIGDTAFFAIANCDDMIEKIYCVDGDPEFFHYLYQNTFDHQKIECINVLLSDSNDLAPGLIRTHKGTASAQGVSNKKSITLDKLVLEMSDLAFIDLIKIDVDGFDGRVLGGSISVLEKFRPAIIFEWHPILFNQTKNSFYEPFRVLKEQNYSTFIWFDKYGKFSHFDLDVNSKQIELVNEICLNNKHEMDWHYDIIALHRSSDIDIVKLAELSFAKCKKSFY